MSEKEEKGMGFLVFGGKRDSLALFLLKSKEFPFKKTNLELTI